jgi:tRNA threonylcarbamoyladenosine biosynthesis protein TsaE
MRKVFTTNNSKQTQKLGEILAEEIISHQKRTDRSQPKRPKADRPLGALVICLEGDLGSGKTTFTQGLLKGLGARGPYTSPTFVIMKKYQPHPTPPLTEGRGLGGGVFHIDAYRVSGKDILNLGWKELVAEKNNVIIIEWADRIRKIIPRGALWIKFEWVDENKRRVIFK